MNRAATILIATMILLPAAGLAEEPAVFHVAANGNDRWSGTPAEPDAAGDDGPFATFARARDAVRQVKKDRPVLVLIRGGTWRLDRTFTLGPEDSGSADAPVTWAAFPGEQPVISGGKLIESKWTRGQDGVWSCEAGGEEWIQDLFINGVRAPRARMPNLGHFNAKAVGNSHTQFDYPAGQLDAWADAGSGVVVIYPYEWVDFHLPIKSIDAQQRRVTLAKPCGYQLVTGGYGSNGEYRVENVRAAIDLPGEWCHDRLAGKLFLIPPQGVDPNKAEIVAGRLPLLISLSGDAKKDRWVEHVNMEGLTFAYTARDGQYRHYSTTAVRMGHGVRICRVERCRFFDLGASGVVLWKECVGCTVAGNEFTRNGDTPIRINDYLGEGPAVSANHRIANNWIHHCNAVQQSICGIEISGSANNLVAHNLIHDMPYIGIRLSGMRTDYWNARNAPDLKPPFTAARIKPHVPVRGNVVELNHIHHVMQELYDGGGIYFWGTMGEGPNAIRRNLVHHVGTGKRIAVGLYLDDSTDDVIVRDNVVFGVGMGLHLHGAPRNLVENNLFAYCSERDMAIQPERYNVAPMNTTVRHNIFAWGRGELFSTGEGWNRNWDKKPISEMDHNLYWRGGAPIKLGQGNLAGFDEHSAVAEPGITVEQHGKLIVRPGEAAGKLGIRPIDLTGVGLAEPAPWVKDVPRVELRFPLPESAVARLPGFAPWQSNVQTPLPAGSANLVRNDDLEAGKTGPAEWDTLWWGTSNEKNEADRDPKCQWAAEGPDGSHCFKITSANAERMANRQGGWHQRIASPGPGRYVLLFDVKADKVASANPADGGSFSAYVHVVNKDGSHGANLGVELSTLRRGSFDWLRREVVIEVPAEAKELTIIFQVQRVTGTVWIDNVQLVRLSSSE